MIKIDKEYIRKREKLIPIAVVYANKMCGSKVPKTDDDRIKEQWAKFWNKAFHSKMDELVIELEKSV